MGSIDTAPEAVTLEENWQELKKVLQKLDHTQVRLDENDKRIGEISVLKGEKHGEQLTLTITTHEDANQNLIGLCLNIINNGIVEIHTTKSDSSTLKIEMWAWNSFVKQHDHDMPPDCLSDEFPINSPLQQIKEVLAFIKLFIQKNLVFREANRNAITSVRKLIEDATHNAYVVSGASSKDWMTSEIAENLFATTANFKRQSGNEDAAFVSSTRVCVVDGVSTNSDETALQIDKPVDFPLHTLIAGAAAQGIPLTGTKRLITQIPELDGIRAALVDAVRKDDTNEWIIQQTGDTRWFVINSNGTVVQASTMDHALGRRLESISPEEKRAHVQAVINHGKIECNVNFDDDAQLDTICRYTIAEDSRMIYEPFPSVKANAIKQTVVSVPKGGLLYLCTDGVDDFIAPQHVGQMWATHQKVSTVGQEICDTVSRAQGVPRKIMVGTGIDGQPVWLSIPGTYGDHATFALVAA